MDNYQMEGPGVPEFRPQQSQRSDQEPKEPPLNDRTLREVAKRLGCDWVTLAVEELGSTTAHVQVIEKNYQNDIIRQGQEMLVTWKQAQSTSVKQQRTTLCTALKNIGKADIAGFLHGVPAPRPQHSPRPDQEPRQRAPSYQEAGNKTRDILKTVYKTTGSYVQLLPAVDNDQMHIAGIYTKVQLETREGVAVVTGKKGETVNSTEYAKIFRLRTASGELIERLIFVGMGGVGKSTIFDKIAYDWADETSEILKRFKLVFLLKMCALSQESDLVGSTFDQLLDEDAGIATDELDQFIQANANEVLILLDGFDEMKIKTLDAASFGSVLKALHRTRYRKCLICVSTRPSHLETLMSKSLVQNPCIHVEVLGFTDEDVHEYVQKFYVDDPDSGNALSQTIQKSNTLREFAKTPMLLLLMCLLWRDNKQLPETTSRLFTEAVDHMFTRKLISEEDVSKTVISIGQTALRGLISDNQKFSFQEDEFEPNALNLALTAGILTKQRVIKNRKSHNNIQFMHKTMQEYCAAKYLQSIHGPMSNHGSLKWIDQLCQTIEGVVSNEFLFRFCCGDSVKFMTDIVNLLDSKFNKYKPKYQSDVVQAISRNCFLESQSEEVPRCLTSDSHIPSTIVVENNNDFRSLVYLLEIICRSESRTEQLVRVDTIEVSSVSSVRDLASALVYMENLRALRLRGCPLVKGDFEKVLSSLKCNKLLIDLCIQGDNTLGDRAIEWVPHIKHFTGLNKLELSDCNLQTTDIEQIASSAIDIRNLTDLILAGNTALGQSAKLWANHLSQFTNIQTLNLSIGTLQWTDIEHIASAVGDMPSLTNLILAGNKALGGSAELWAKILSRFTNIQTLNLNSCTLQWTDIEHIASAVSDMPKLADLILVDNPELGVSTEIWSRYLLRIKQKHTLDLSNFSLTFEDVSTISVVLDNIPALTNLILAGNTALGRLGYMWTNHLSRFTNIKTLNLSYCTLQWTDIKHIASAVSDMPSLTDLILAGNTGLGESTEKWSRYLLRVKQNHTLDLSNFSLTWEDVGTVSVMLDHNPKLTNLILAGNTTLGGSAELGAKNLSRLTNTQTLNLSNCTLQWTDIEHIASAVDAMPCLTDLILAGNRALGGSAKMWAKHLSRLKNIQTMNLSNCTLQWTDIEHIALAVSDMPRLIDLILAGNTALGGSAELGAKILLRFTTIQTLNLSNCTLQWTDIEHIASAVGDKPRLTDLILAGNTALGRSAEMWANYLSRFTNVKTLNLSYCTLQWTDIERIASAEVDKPNLTDLILAGNTALGRSAEMWANCLSRFTNIKMLNLSNCTLQWTDIEHIASAVVDMPSLTDLILAGNTALGRSGEMWANYLSRFTNIKMLNLSNCTLQWTDIEHIASAVGDMPSLTDLILAGNTALGRSGETWANSVLRFTNLKTLNLSNCALQWTDIEHIASVVGVMPRLTHFILTDNPAFGVSTKKWSCYLLRVKQKHTVDLSNFSLTWEDVGTISVVLDHIPTLTNLILAGNTALGRSAEMWAHYLSRFKNIKMLNLSNCTLKWSDIEHIASAVGDMPSLTDLILAGNPDLGESTEKWSRYLMRVKQKRTLDLNDFSLTWKDVGTIPVVLNLIPTLNNLTLAGNWGLGASAHLWAKELPRMTHLIRLDLTSCNLMPSDIKYIASALLDMPKLTDFTLGDNQKLSGSSELWAKELQKITYLNRLDLSSCRLTPSDIKCIKSAVLDMPRLAHLILSSNRGFDSLDDDN